MAVKIHYSAHTRHWTGWIPALTAAFAETELDAQLTTDADAPESFDYMVHSPDGPVSDFRPFTNLRAVLSTWAGVENIVHNETLTVPLVRMVDPGMIEGMVEWVTAHVLRHHINLDELVLNEDGRWLKHISPPLARTRTVAMLGLGVLGTACSKSLMNMNFNVIGWSRSQKKIGGMECMTGMDGLRSAISRADFAVLLMPLTSETENIVGEDFFSRMKDGAVFLNAGRGGLVDDEALLRAVDSGKLRNATLDVFRQEPLPPQHPFHLHPGVTVSPHIASETRPETASRVIAENIARDIRGLPLMNLVDRRRGY